MPNGVKVSKSLRWANRLGIDAISAVISWVTVTWLRLGPAIVRGPARLAAAHKPVAIAATIAIALVAAQAVYQWLRSAGRSLRHGMLDRCLWAISGSIAGVALALPIPAWEKGAAAIAGLAVPAIPRIIARPARRREGPGDSERPIARKEDDWIGRQDLVRALAEQASHGEETVIALLGALGSGKSSVLHLLQAELAAGDPPPIVVSFSAWLPSHPEGLAGDLIESIEESIRNRYWWPALSRATRGFAAALGAHRPTLGAALSAFHDVGQQQRLERLSNALRQLPQKVIVLVDEIDRMDRAEIAELFKVLRGAPDLENICFICAMDPEQAARTLADPTRDPAAMAHAREYLEKFFADRFELPMPSEEAMQAELAKRLEKVLAEQPPTGGKEMLMGAIKGRWPGWQFYGTVITTPRRLKAAAKALQHAIACSKESLNALDLFNLCLLRDRAGGLLWRLYENRAILLDTNRSSWTDSPVESPDFLKSESDQSEQDSRLDQLVKELAERAAGAAVVQLMAMLFPRCAESAARLKLSLSHIPRDNGEGGERRIAHPRFFMRYLTATIPGSQFPEATLNQLIKEMSDAPDRAEEIMTDALTETAGGTDDLRCWDLLIRLDESVDKVAPDAFPGVARAIAALAPQLAGGGLVADPKLAALRLVLSLAAAASKSSREDVQRLLEEFVSATPDEVFAAQFAIAATKPDRRPELKGIDSAAIQRKFASVMASRYNAGSTASLFRYGGPGLAILVTWAKWAGSESGLVADYLERELADDPGKLAMLATWLPVCEQSLPFFTMIYGDRLALIQGRLEGLISGAGLSGDDETALKRLQSCLSAPPPTAAAAEA
ncbi:MAG TPA: P-loop NTPase fold protein [Terriglobales bacterium]|nr:P-loop NTPase fold protein [Terriglobales bacterium]